MKINVDFSALWSNVSRMGAKIVDAQLETNWADSDLEFDTQLSNGSLEISLDQLESAQGLLSIKGRQVILFISDHGHRIDDALENPSTGKKFHVFDCKTIKEMKAKNRIERYHVTNSNSGDFPIFGTTKYGAFKKGEARLQICKNCINELNYKNSAQLSVDERNRIVTGFNFSEFFSTYSSLFKHHPKPKGQSNEFGYSKDWDAITAREKANAKFTCQGCHVNLESNKRLLHTHHINGVKHDNSATNLICLCADCHRKEPFHGHMYIKHADMQLINRLRKEQGILMENSWTNIKQHIDPALHGLIHLAQKKISSAPKISHTIKNPTTGRSIELDIAWPDHRLGIYIGEKFEIPQWKIFNHDEALDHFG
jgi:hypothetical protein